jgi:hypothetical protein
MGPRRASMAVNKFIVEGKAFSSAWYRVSAKKKDIVKDYDQSSTWDAIKYFSHG